MRQNKKLPITVPVNVNQAKELPVTSQNTNSAWINDGNAALTTAAELPKVECGSGMAYIGSSFKHAVVHICLLFHSPQSFLDNSLLS